MLRLYDFLPSGNGYKVRLLLTQLGIPFELIEKDILRRETRTPEFLKLNPNGRIPVVELENGSHLAESNAILFHFAEGTRFICKDRLGRAKIFEWLFFEQYSHEPYVAVARFWTKFADHAQKTHAEVEEKRQGARAALSIMERHLTTRTFLVGEQYTIADIALYAYTHIAHECDYDLATFPAVRAWLKRIAAQADHVAMDFNPANAAVVS